MELNFAQLQRAAEEDLANTTSTRIDSADGSYVCINQLRDRVWVCTCGGICYRCKDLADAKSLADRLVTAWSKGDYTIEDAQDIKERCV